MEKTLSDIQLAEVDKKSYEDLAAQTLRDGYHNLAWEYQKKANKAERLLESLKQQERKIKCLKSK